MSRHGRPDENHNFHELTYAHLRIIDCTLDENLPLLPSTSPSPQRNCAVQPHAHRNALDVLPLELLHLLISQLDLQTLSNFQRTSRSMLELVNSHPQYQAIKTHARSALCSILATKLGQSITCERLYMTLCTADCEQCGDFAGYIYLLGCRRVCFLCFTQRRRYLPLKQLHAVRMFGLSRQEIKTLPQIRTLPGTYSPNRKLCHGRLTLVDYDCARDAGIRLHGSLAAIESYNSSVSQQKAEKEQKRKTGSSTRSGSRSRRPSTSTPYDRKSSNPLRFMAIVSTPWLNRSSQTVEPARYCFGCEKSYDSYRPENLHFRRRFTVHTFGKHLRECGNIKDGKHQSRSP